jgi:hypothetical protein
VVPVPDQSEFGHAEPFSHAEPLVLAEPLRRAEPLVLAEPLPRPLRPSLTIKQRFVALVGTSGTAGRVRFERVWFWVTVAYSIIRIATAWLFLTQFGVNPWVFGVIEIISSMIYGKASSLLAGALVDQNRPMVRRMALITAGGFLAPDVYIVASGNGIPTTVYFVMAVLASLGIWAFVREIRRRN